MSRREEFDELSVPGEFSGSYADINEVDSGVVDTNSLSVGSATGGSIDVTELYEGGSRVATQTWVNSQDFGSGGQEYGNVYNALDEGYGNRSGDICDLFRQARDAHDKFTVILPEGDYSVESGFTIGQGGSHTVEIIGEPEATLHVENNTFDNIFTIGHYYGDWGPSQITIRNLFFDISQSGVDAGLGLVTAMDRLLIENIEMVGQRTRATNGGGRFTVFAQVGKESGIGYVRDVDISAGSEYDGYSGSNCIGFAADPGHRGTMIWEGCHVEEHWDNGFYVNGSPGTNELIGGFAKNCGRANIRIGRGDVARYCKSVWDMPSLPSGWESQSYPDLLDIDDTDGATSAYNCHLVNIDNQNQAISVRTNSETVRLEAMEVVQIGTTEWIFQCSSNPTSGANDNHEYRDNYGDKGTVIISGGFWYEETAGGSIRNRAFQTGHQHLILDGITFISEYNNAGEEYRACAGIGTSSGKLTMRDCYIEGNSPHSAIARPQNGAVLSVKGCQADTRYTTFADSGGYLTFVDNDCRNVTDGHWNDPSGWTADMEVRGNFGL